MLFFASGIWRLDALALPGTDISGGNDHSGPGAESRGQSDRCRWTALVAVYSIVVLSFEDGLLMC